MRISKLLLLDPCKMAVMVRKPLCRTPFELHPPSGAQNNRKAPARSFLRDWSVSPRPRPPGGWPARKPSLGPQPTPQHLDPLFFPFPLNLSISIKMSHTVRWAPPFRPTVASHSNAILLLPLRHLKSTFSQNSTIYPLFLLSSPKGLWDGSRRIPCFLLWTILVPFPSHSQPRAALPHFSSSPHSRGIFCTSSSHDQRVDHSFLIASQPVQQPRILSLHGVAFVLSSRSPALPSAFLDHTICFWHPLFLWSDFPHQMFHDNHSLLQLYLLFFRRLLLALQTLQGENSCPAIFSHFIILYFLFLPPFQGERFYL